MTTLMTYAGEAAADASVTRTGGLPLAPADFAWPRCGECDGGMQFLAQVLLEDLGIAARIGAVSGRGILSIFMCQNDPGMCDEWDPNSGGNRALVFPPGNLVCAVPPQAGNTLLAEVSAVTYIRVDENDYDRARGRWCDRQSRPLQDVLGQLGGEPSWVQNDERPNCPTCSGRMAFVAQLEEGHNYRTAANFGSGCAYAFACEPCEQGAFLWQQ